MEVKSKERRRRERERRERERERESKKILCFPSTLLSIPFRFLSFLFFPLISFRLLTRFSPPFPFSSLLLAHVCVCVCVCGIYE